MSAPRPDGSRTSSVPLLTGPEPGGQPQRQQAHSAGELDDEARRAAVREDYPCDRSHRPATV